MPFDVASRPMLIARRLAVLLFAAFSAAMLGFAAGAVWMLPTMFLQRPLPWLAIPVGALLGWAVRYWVRPAGRVAALLAAAASALAGIYVSMLTAAVRIAGSMGLGLTDAMREAGAGMLLQLARMALSGTELAWFAAGAVVAAWAAARPSTRR
jgi:hypothetical protein